MCSGSDKPTHTEIPWDIYPRPQLRRTSYFSLNGEWQFDLTPPGTVTDEGEVSGVPILVPFCPESPMSGVGLLLSDRDVRFYRRSFTLPEDFWGPRVLLNFGAVDQRADVFLNGHFVGSHEGGYEPFSFDIAPWLQKDNDLLLRVEDHLSEGRLPYGKQKQKSGGMWYTPVSGIWQSVWLECVPMDHISGLTVQTKGNKVSLYLHVYSEKQDCRDLPVPEVRFSAGEGDGTFTEEGCSAPIPAPASNKKNRIYDYHCSFTVPDACFWSPETPFLYGLSATYGDDAITSYFGLRDLTTDADAGGIPRLCLNGKPYFYHGVLDQGYYPEGVFTPGSPARILSDLQYLKDSGFNMLRKHIKVEPELFYYYCDRMGIAVFQDMVENGHYSYLRDTLLPNLGLNCCRSDRHLHRDPGTRKAFLQGMETTVRTLGNHPSIVLWTIFNEGWGQFSGTEVYRKLRALDSGRPIDIASGWFRRVESDVISRHVYFRKLHVKPGKRPVILSEYGGLVLKVPNHSPAVRAYGYGKCKTDSELQIRLLSLYRDQLLPAVRKGLCADVYTQLSDVEEELNGLLTYDREAVKIPAEELHKLSLELMECFAEAVNNE